MNVILFVIGIGAIAFGVWELKDPEGVLNFRDHRRIKGEREYTKLAISGVKRSGVILIVIGIVSLIASFVAF